MYNRFTIAALFISLIFLTGCAGSITSKVTEGYTPPPSEEIAVSYLDYADINVSNLATKVFEEELNRCKLVNFKSAADVEELLQANNIVIPRRMTNDMASKLKKILNVKYLLTGGLTIWKEGSVGFPVASSTEVGASLTMYDLDNGEIVWTVSGEETGGAGIFSEKPETKAKQVFRRMLLKWKGFCQ